MAAVSYKTVQFGHHAHQNILDEAATRATTYSAAGAVIGGKSIKSSILGGVVGGAAGHAYTKHQVNKNRKLVRKGVMSPYEGNKKNKRALRTGSAISLVVGNNVAFYAGGGRHYIETGDGVDTRRHWTSRQKGQISTHSQKLVDKKGGIPFIESKVHTRSWGKDSKKLLSRTKFDSSMSHDMINVHHGGDWQSMTRFNNKSHTHYGIHPGKAGAAAAFGVVAAGGAAYAYRRHMKNNYYYRTVNGKQIRVRKGRRSK